MGRRADDAIFWTLRVSSIALVILLVVFDVIRSKVWYVYAPRTRHTKYRDATPPEPAPHWLGWVSAVFKTWASEAFLWHAGVDGLVMILFLKYVVDQCLAASIVGVCCLVPAWWTARGLKPRGDYSFALTTVANLKCEFRDDKFRGVLFPPCKNTGVYWRLTLAVVCAWLLTLRALSKLSLICCEFVQLRSWFLSTRLDPSTTSASVRQHALTVMVERIPTSWRSSKRLKTHFEALCGENTVHSARLVVDGLGSLDVLFSRWEKAVEALYDARSKRARLVYEKAHHHRSHKFNESSTSSSTSSSQGQRRRRTWRRPLSWLDSPFNASQRPSPSSSLRRAHGEARDSLRLLERAVSAVETAVSEGLSTRDRTHSDSNVEPRLSLRTNRRGNNTCCDKRQVLAVPYYEALVADLEDFILLEHVSRLVACRVSSAEQDAAPVPPPTQEHPMTVVDEKASPHAWARKEVEDDSEKKRSEYRRRLAVAIPAAKQTIPNVVENDDDDEDAGVRTTQQNGRRRVRDDWRARRSLWRGVFWALKMPMYDDDEDEKDDNDNNSVGCLERRQRSIRRRELRQRREPPLPTVFVDASLTMGLRCAVKRSSLWLETALFVSTPDVARTCVEGLESVVVNFVCSRRCRGVLTEEDDTHHQDKTSKASTTPSALASLREGKVKDLAMGLNNLTQCRQRPSSTAFVTFTSPTARLLALHSLLVARPFGVVALPAPEARDVVFANAHVDHESLGLRTAIVGLGLYVVALFWGAIVTLCSNSGKLLSYVGVKEYSNTYQLLAQSVLPVALVMSIINILPLLFQGLARFYERQKSTSAIDLSVVERFFRFQFVNVYVSILSAAILNNLRDAWKNPFYFVKFVAENAYSPASMLYLTKLLIFGCGASPLWVLRAWPLISRGWKYWTVQPVEVPGMLYGWAFPKMIMISTIFMTFWVAAPLISPVALIYFILITLYFRYILLFVHMPQYDTGGRFFYAVIDRICFGLMVSNLILFCWLFGNSLTGLAICVLPLPLIVYIFRRFADVAYKEPSETVSLTQARRREKAESGVRPDDFDASLYLQPSRRKPPDRSETCGSSGKPHRVSPLENEHTEQKDDASDASSAVDATKDLAERLERVVRAALGTASEVEPDAAVPPDDADEDALARYWGRVDARTSFMLSRAQLESLRPLVDDSARRRNVAHRLLRVYRGEADYFDDDDDEDDGSAGITSSVAVAETAPETTVKPQPVVEIDPNAAEPPSSDARRGATPPELPLDTV